MESLLRRMSQEGQFENQFDQEALCVFKHAMLAPGEVLER